MTRVNIIERKIKEKLYSKLIEYYTVDEIIEWVYEEYGKKVSPRNLKRFIINSEEVSARDLAVLLLERNYNPEQDWLSILREGSAIELKQRRLPGSAKNGNELSKRIGEEM